MLSQRLSELTEELTGIDQKSVANIVETQGTNNLLATATIVCKTQDERDKLEKLFEIKNLYETVKAAGNSNVYSINSTEDAEAYFKAYLADTNDKERFAATFLDENNNIIASKVMSVGTVDAANLHVREVIKEAVFYKAVSVIASHNHPGGARDFSRSDIEATSELEKALNSVGVRLMDHILVTNDSVASMAAMGLGNFYTVPQHPKNDTSDAAVANQFNKDKERIAAIIEDFTGVKREKIAQFLNDAGAEALLYSEKQLSETAEQEKRYKALFDFIFQHKVASEMYSGTTIKIDSTDKSISYFRNYFAEKKPENTIEALYLNATYTVLASSTIKDEDKKTPEEIVNEITRDAVNCNARTVMIANNVQDNSAKLSSRAVHVTKAITTALERLGINVADHIINTPTAAVSMADESFVYSTTDNKTISLLNETTSPYRTNNYEETPASQHGLSVTIGIEDVQSLRTLPPRKSILNFTAEEKNIAQKWALKYSEELGEKSPFYRAENEWRDKDEAIVSVIEIEDRGIDVATARADIKGAGKIKRGIYTNIDTGWDVLVSRVGIEETIALARRHEDRKGSLDVYSRLNALYQISDVLENAILLDTCVSTPEKSKTIGTAFMHNFYSLVSFQSKPTLFAINVEEYYNPHESEIDKRFYSLKHINIVPIEIGVSGPLFLDRTSRAESSNDTAVSVADLYELVKQNDKNFYTNIKSAVPFELTSEKPHDKLKEITDKLENGIKGIFESEQYKTYLNTLSKFHNYSFNNCMLIAMQKPDATYVGSFNFWKKEMERHVLRGEKGIKIIAPVPYKTKKEVDKLDAHGKPVYKDGKREKEEVEATALAYKVVSVFDVSQTDGKPMPQIGVGELTGSVDRYKDFFAALEKASPVPIGFEPIASGAKGYYHITENRIAVNAGMSDLQNLKTAIHEIVHARIHSIDGNAPADEHRPDRRTREVEAESIAYTVCQHYGLDTSDYSFAYIAKWSGDKDSDALKASLAIIRNEANAIITEIDKHFKTQTIEPSSDHTEPGTSVEVNEPAAEYKTTQSLYAKAAQTISNFFDRKNNIGSNIQQSADPKQTHEVPHPPAAIQSRPTAQQNTTQWKGVYDDMDNYRPSDEEIVEKFQRDLEKGDVVQESLEKEQAEKKAVVHTGNTTPVTVASLHEAVDNEIERIFADNAKFANFLSASTYARDNGYEYAVLVSRQMPNATHTFEQCAWLDRGRDIKPNAHGISVLVPELAKKEDADRITNGIFWTLKEALEKSPDSAVVAVAFGKHEFSMCRGNQNKIDLSLNGERSDISFMLPKELRAYVVENVVEKTHFGHSCKTVYDFTDTVVSENIKGNFINVIPAQALKNYPNRAEYLVNVCTEIIKAYGAAVYKRTPDVEQAISGGSNGFYKMKTIAPGESPGFVVIDLNDKVKQAEELINVIGDVAMCSFNNGETLKEFKGAAVSYAVRSMYGHTDSFSPPNIASMKMSMESMHETLKEIHAEINTLLTELEGGLGELGFNLDLSHRDETLAPISPSHCIQKRTDAPTAPVAETAQQHSRSPTDEHTNREDLEAG